MTTVTISCKYCNDNFTIDSQDDILCCSVGCLVKSKIYSGSLIHESRNHGVIRTSLCIQCKYEFKHYGERIVCSNQCNDKYIRNSNILSGMIK